MTDELYTQTETNDYKRGAYIEVDIICNAEKYVSKTEGSQSNSAILSTVRNLNHLYFILSLSLSLSLLNT